MKNIISKKSLLFSIFSFGILMFFSVSVAHASTPTLSLVPTGDGDSVQINVAGDPNASVVLFYNKSGSGQQIDSLGTTNTSGIFTDTISTSSYGIIAGSSVYVTTGGISGSQSASIAWPAVASLLSPSNMLSLSQTGLVLTLNQSATITASNLNSSSLYLSNNSNPVIANFSVSSSQITVTANSYGSTTGTFCLINNTTNCGSVYVIVQNSSAQPLTFSQSSVSISSGQTVAVQISGGSGVYSVLSNSTQNGGLVSTSISGSTITLTTTSTTGASSITLCTTDMTACGIINVTIGNATSSAISFSQTNPTVAVAQSLNISIFGPTSSFFYVNSNSNPSVVQANISSNTLTLLGITNGTSVINVCTSGSNCGSLTVAVNSNSSTGGSLTLSQDSVYLSTNQTINITISGGAMPYSILSNGGNLVQSSLNGNILTLEGLSTGTSLMNICSTSGNCATLSINVNISNPASTLSAGCSSASGYSMTTGVSCSTVISTPSVTLPTGCISTSGYSQTTGQLCNNSVPAPVVTIPADCTGTAFSISTGEACPADTIITTPVVAATPIVVPVSTSAAFTFTKSLKLGSTGSEVIQLQTKLKSLGYYTGKLDGGFGSLTEKAVKAFQKAKGISQVGNVGPQTRAGLNQS